ncbi:hypothetical protein JXJ21_14560 [candidate division KSB1 bacterium]|nr:hypothetical protein [candidate division KSB1 bacterium]
MRQLKISLWLIYIFAGLLYSVKPVCLHAAEDRYRNLLAEGSLYIKQRDFKQAEHVLKMAIELAPEKSAAHLVLGYVKMLENQWGDAKRQFDTVLETDPDQILAHYQLGICDREDGIARDPVTRKILWRNARKHFRKVIQQDSSFMEVFNEYAHLERYDSNYEKAIELCLIQIRLRPHLTRPLIDIHEFYDYFLAHGGESILNPFKNIDQYQIEWLQKRSAKYDIYYLGDKYRQMERFDAADSIFRELLARDLPFTRIPLMLSRTRLLYQKNQPQEAENLYWQTIESITALYEIEFVFNDAKFIMSNDDLKVYFRNILQMQQFYERFWNAKNPLAGSGNNPRLEEHYRRLVYAEKHYRYDGFRLFANDPDFQGVLTFPAIFYENTKFNDKGLVYIRYGKPNEMAVQPGEFLANNESWLYNQTPHNPKMIFHFEVHKEGGAPGNWRLVSIPSDPRMIESRLGWDSKLDRYYLARSALERLNAISEVQQTSRDIVHVAMNKERHTWPGETTMIPFHISTAHFLDEDQQDRIEFYIGVSRSELFKRDVARDTCHLETGLALHDTLWNRLFKQTRERQLESNDTRLLAHDLFIENFKPDVFKSKSMVAIHIKDLNAPRIGGYKFTLSAAPFPRSGLVVSDLVLSYKIEPWATQDEFSRRGFRIVPNPMQAFSKNELVHLYYEIYRLNLKNGRTRYKINQTATLIQPKWRIFGKFINLFRGKKRQTLSIESEREGQASFSNEYTAFDFSEFNSGKIKLTIKITDLNSGQATESSTQFELD